MNITGPTDPSNNPTTRSQLWAQTGKPGLPSWPELLAQLEATTSSRSSLVGRTISQVSEPVEESKELTSSSSSSSIADSANIALGKPRQRQNLDSANTASKKTKTTAVQDLKRAFSFPYATAEDPILKPLLARIFLKFQTVEVLDPQILAHYEAALAQRTPPHGMLVCKINDSVGCGLFLNPKAAPIKAGTFLGLYAGKISITSMESPSPSRFILTLFPEVELELSEQREINEQDPSKDNLYYIDIDAAEKGNFTRYFNHAKMANVTWRRVQLPNGTFQIGFFASKEIFPGRQLLIDYGKGYWESIGINPTPITDQTYTLNHDLKIEKHRAIRGRN